MYLQNKTLAYTNEPTNGSEDVPLQLDNTESLYGLFDDTSASWQTLNDHLSPASLQQSPPCGSAHDRPAYTITSPTKQQVKWVSQPVMLSDLADYSPLDFVDNGKTLCSHVSYDNRRCTNIVSMKNRFCGNHKMMASTLTSNSQSATNGLSGDEAMNRNHKHIGIKCVSPRNIFSREHQQDSNNQTRTFVKNGTDVPDSFGKGANTNHVSTGAAYDTSAPPSCRNVTSTNQVLNHGNISMKPPQSTVLNANINHGKKVYPTIPPQAKTIVLNESSLKMLVEIMSSKQKKLTPQQVNFLLSLDITVNQTSDKVKIISQNKPIKIESRKFPTLHPAVHKKDMLNMQLPKTFKPTLLQSAQPHSQFHGLPTLATSKVKLNKQDHSKVKLPLKRKMLSENKQFEKKPRLSSNSKRNHNCVNNKLPSTVSKQPVAIEIQQNKLPALLPVHEYYSTEEKRYLQIHNNQLLKSHHFFPHFPQVDNRNDKNITKKSSSDEMEYINCSPLDMKDCEKFLPESYINEKSSQDQNHVTIKGPTIDELSHNTRAMCKSYRNITNNYLNELKHKRTVTKTLLDLHKHSPQLAKKTLEKTENIKKSSSPACTKNNICQLKDGTGMATCGDRALPFALYCKNHMWNCADQQLYVVDAKMQMIADIELENKNIKKTRKRTKLLPLTKRYKKKKKKNKNKNQTKIKNEKTKNILKDANIPNVDPGSAYDMDDHETILQHDLERLTEDFNMFEDRNGIGLLPTREETEELERTLLMEMSNESLDKVGVWLEDFAIDELGCINDKEHYKILPDKPKDLDRAIESPATITSSQCTTNTGGCDILSEDSGIQQDMAYHKHSAGPSNIDPFTDVIDTTEVTDEQPPHFSSGQHYTFGSCLCGLSDLSSGSKPLKMDQPVPKQKRVEADEGANTKDCTEIPESKPSLYSNELQEIECVLESLHSESAHDVSMLADSSVCNVNEKQYTTMLAQQLSQEAETQNFNKPASLPKYPYSDKLMEYDHMFPTSNSDTATLYINDFPHTSTTNNNMKDYIKTEVTTASLSTCVKATSVTNVLKLSTSEPLANTTSSFTATSSPSKFVNGNNSSVQHSPAQQHSTSMFNASPSTANGTISSSPPHNRIVFSSSDNHSNAVSMVPATTCIAASNVGSINLPQQAAMLQMVGNNNVIPLMIGTGTQNGNMVKVLIPQNAIMNNAGNGQQSMIIIPVNPVVKNDVGQPRQLSSETTSKPLTIAPMNTVKVQMANLQTGQQFLIVNGNQQPNNVKKTNPLLAQKYIPPALILNPVTTRGNTLISPTSSTNGINASLKCHNRLKPAKTNKKCNKNASTSVKQKLHKTIMKHGRKNCMNKSTDNLNAETKRKNEKKSLKQSNSVPCTSYSTNVAPKTSCINTNSNGTYHTTALSNNKCFVPSPTPTHDHSDKSEPVCRTMDRRSKSGPTLSDDEVISEEQGGVDIGDEQNASCGVVHWNQTTTAGPNVHSTNITSVYSSNVGGTWCHQKHSSQNQHRITTNPPMAQQMILGNLGASQKSRTKINIKQMKLPTLATDGRTKRNEKQKKNSFESKTQQKDIPDSLGFVKIGVDSFCSSPINVKMSSVKLTGDSFNNNRDPT